MVDMYKSGKKKNDKKMKKDLTFSKMLYGISYQ